ncbi:MAG: oligosaccharide flippase family protein, partial [Candidatus Paceibacteria bacterium]
LLSFVIVFLFRSGISNFANTPSLSPFIRVLASLIVFEASLQIALKLFGSTKKMKYRVLVWDIGRPLLQIAIIIPIIYHGYDVIGLTIGYTVTTIIAVLLGWYLVFNHIPELDLSPKVLLTPATTVPSGIFNYILPIYFTGILFIISTHISYFIIAFYLNTSQVGTYRIAYQLTINLVIVNSAITPVFKPMIAETSDIDLIEYKYQTATRWTMLLTIPMGLVLITAPKTYVELFFSSDYTIAAPAVVFLSAGHIINSVTGPESMLIEALGHTRLLLLIAFVKAIVGIVLGVIL